MNAVYEITNKLRVFLEQRQSLSTVKYGDIDEVDLNKTTLFPLAHFFLQSAQFNRRTITFRLNLMFLDIVDAEKGPLDESLNITEDQFYKSNLHEVLNDLHKEVVALLTTLTDYRGSLATEQYVLQGEPTAEMLYEEFENKLAGWGLTLDIEVPNDINACIEI